MANHPIRFAALLAALASFALSSCGGPVTAGKVGSPEFYWGAARETYAAGDYPKTIQHLDHLIDTSNEYTARAIPWSLVLTSGLAAGYMDLADHYVSGARVHKASGLEFRRKATEYRTVAAEWALRFAQSLDKLNQLKPGAVQLAFSLPVGNPAMPAELARIAKGIQPSPEDVATVESLAIQRSVLLTACLSAGTPNDTARADHVLGRAAALTPRATFAAALAQLLARQSTPFARDQLDEPKKLASLKQRNQTVTAWAR